MRTKFTTIILLLFIMAVNLDAQLIDPINYPGGRIMLSSDGNAQDVDEFGGIACFMAMVKYAGLQDKVVHVNYCNNMGKNENYKYGRMLDIVDEGTTRFGYNKSIFFDCQTNESEAITHFIGEANKCTVSDPLWILCAGPMEMVYRMLNAVSADKRQYINCISHAPWNETHKADTDHSDWEEMKADFPLVNYINIANQNGTISASSTTVDKDNGFSSYDKYWTRMLDYPDWKWAYDQDEKSNVFDPSDAGMTYWLITGGPNGGNENGGAAETEALFKNPMDGNTDDDGDGIANWEDNCYNTANADQLDADGDGKGDVCDTHPNDPNDGKISDSTIGPKVADSYVVIEMDQTSSVLGDWKLRTPQDASYFAGSAMPPINDNYIQYEGPNDFNKSGEMNSPLEYKFTCPKTGVYHIATRMHQHLNGATTDSHNDVWLKVAGNFTSGSTDHTDAQLKAYNKYLGRG